MVGKNKKASKESEEIARRREAMSALNAGDGWAPADWTLPEDRPEPIDFQAIADQWAKKPYWDCVSEGAALLLGQAPQSSDVDVEVWFRADRDLQARFLDLRDTLKRHVMACNIAPTLPPSDFLDFAESKGIECVEELKSAVEKDVSKPPTASNAPGPEASKKPRNGDTTASRPDSAETLSPDDYKAKLAYQLVLSKYKKHYEKFYEEEKGRPGRKKKHTQRNIAERLSEMDDVKKTGLSESVIRSLCFTVYPPADRLGVYD